MTDNQFKLKLNQMVRTQDFVRDLKDRAIHKAQSGGIDLDYYTQEDFTPVRMCLCAALLEIADQYMPYSKEGKEMVENLSHF